MKLRIYLGVMENILTPPFLGFNDDSITTMTMAAKNLSLIKNITTFFVKLHIHNDHLNDHCHTHEIQ
jgi:hypothetical protein